MARRISNARAIWLLGLLCCLSACQPAPDPKVESLAYLAGWFNQAQSGAQDESLCHGLGLLKNPSFTCADMLSWAAKVDPQTREIGRFKSHDCFQSVCGTFYELEFSGADPAGNEVHETAVLKQDEGQYRLYWYRSNLMQRAIAASAPVEEEKAPEQIAYDKLTALFPSLYEYPPCYGARPSSSTLAGEIFVLDQAPVADLHDLAKTCPETFCFALVGQKIAPLCPN